jgi:hypothetical protein
MRHSHYETAQGKVREIERGIELAIAGAADAREAVKVATNALTATGGRLEALVGGARGRCLCRRGTAA